MAGKQFRTQATTLVEALEALAGELGWRVRRIAVGETEGGAGTVAVTFVPALDGDSALNGTPMESATNGHGAFAAPRANRPGAEGE